MKSPDTKRKPAQRYSIMVIPQGSAAIRRYELSRRVLKLLMAASALFGVVLCVGAVSLFVYRTLYVRTEDARVQAAQFIKERAVLVSQVAELEGSLSRIERFASKIQSAMKANSKDGIQRDSVVGQGPVDVDSWAAAPVGSGLAGSVAQLPASHWKSPFSKSLSSGIKLSLDQLSERLDMAEEKVHSVFALQQDKLYFWASLPTVWPTKGWITSEFGVARSWGGHRRRHEGIDVAAPRGTPIMAPGAGIVTYTGYRKGYGNVVVVDHGYGIVTVYAHCQSVFVNEGSSVRRGMVIASVGNTGRSTGPHLHYEVQVNGVPVNPMLYIMNDL